MHCTQYGYKKHHSTECMLINLFDEVLTGFENNMATIVIFIDLSAAFDTIDIDKLTHILECEIGIDGTALRWFSSFLKGRSQQVRIGSEYSQCADILYGVPQGSVLGPILYNINVRSQSCVFNPIRTGPFRAPHHFFYYYYYSNCFTSLYITLTLHCKIDN